MRTPLISGLLLSLFLSPAWAGGNAPPGYYPGGNIQNLMARYYGSRSPAEQQQLRWQLGQMMRRPTVPQGHAAPGRGAPVPSAQPSPGNAELAARMAVIEERLDSIQVVIDQILIYREPLEQLLGSLNVSAAELASAIAPQPRPAEQPAPLSPPSGSPAPAHSLAPAGPH